MLRLGYPTINLDKKTNEQNIQATKTYLNDMSDNINQYVNYLEARVENLEKQISTLKED